MKSQNIIDLELKQAELRAQTRTAEKKYFSMLIQLDRINSAESLVLDGLNKNLESLYAQLREIRKQLCPYQHIIGTYKLTMSGIEIYSVFDFIKMQKDAPCMVDSRIDLDDFFEFILEYCNVSNLNHIELDYTLYSELQNWFLVAEGYERERA